jgi:endonuclease YncB( thermonuclease family)
MNAFAILVLLVTAVHDGDTLSAGSTRIRLNGVDAPELTQPLGVEARARLAAAAPVGTLIACRPVSVSYDRIVADCWHGDVNLGREQVRAGLAIGDPRYAEPYAAEQRQAHEAGIGIWASSLCEPWRYRRRECGR